MLSRRLWQCLLWWITAAGAAQAQVQWFTAEQPGESGYPFSSHLIVRAGAQASQVQNWSCAFAGANPPRPTTTWWKAFDACGPQTLPIDRPADFAHERTAMAAHGGKSMVATASQDARFTPSGLRITARAQTTALGTNRAVLARGIPESSGKVYFRVPPGPALNFRFSATMNWTGPTLGNRGGFEFRWIPNTIRSATVPRESFIAQHFFDYAKPPTGKPAVREGRLAPGVYLIAWSVNSSMANVSSLVELTMEMAFSACDPSDTDSDGDGMPDVWETKAVPVSGGRCVPAELVFPKDYLPDPSIKDIYVEVDYMPPPSSSKSPSPNRAALDLVKRAFANAPPQAANRPAGAKPESIRLHIVVDEALARNCVSFDYVGDLPPSCGGVFNFSELERLTFGTLEQRTRTCWPDGLTREHILEARRKVFRHAIFVRGIVAGGTTPHPGGATELHGSKPGVFSSFAVVSQGERPLGPPPAFASRPICLGRSLEAKPPPKDAERAEAVTFMHELGHTLGLWHTGGDTDADLHEYKPNYMSIMNYYYATVAGLEPMNCQVNKGGALRSVQVPIDYSREDLDDLHECKLHEAAGLRGPAGKPESPWVVYGNSPSLGTVIADAAGPIDWNWNGAARDVITDPGQYIRNVQVTPPPADCEKPLTGHNDWKTVIDGLSCRKNMPDNRC